MSDLVRSRGPQDGPKISTRTIIREVAQHANVDYATAADIVYAFLHYIKYAAFTSDERLVLRNFGTFYRSEVKGRVYGKHVSAETYHPDRIKLGVTSSLIERDRWKSTQSILKAVSSALDAALKPSSMDLSVCARIADLVLSSKPLPELTNEAKVDFARQWIYATGAAPLLPAVTQRTDQVNRPFSILKFRLKGDERSVYVFDYEPDPLFATVITKGPGDIFFFKDGWSSSGPVRARINNELPKYDFGRSPEDNCKALYLAYKVAKYGEKGFGEA